MKNVYMYVCVCITDHLAIQQKLAQHCKSTLLYQNKLKKMLIGNISSGMSQYQGSELLVRELGILARVHVAGSEGCGFWR